MHPDKNKDDPKANEKFQDITWCHDVLTDDKKRKKYDRGGEKAINEDSGGGWVEKIFEKRGILNLFFRDHFDMGGFGGMFGGMFGFGNQQEEIRKVWVG